jgi:hypothetical protein
LYKHLSDVELRTGRADGKVCSVEEQREVKSDVFKVVQYLGYREVATNVLKEVPLKIWR